MALPLVGYELSNGQNKLIALAFMLAALFFFEKKKTLLSSFFFNLALTVYIPLFAFIFYFILRSRGRFILDFIVGALLVFFILPSLVYGFDFNLFLLKTWFLRCLEPFSMATSYATYTDLRVSSQTLPERFGPSFCFRPHERLQISYFSRSIALSYQVFFSGPCFFLVSCGMEAADLEVARFRGGTLFDTRFNPASVLYLLHVGMAFCDLFCCV